MPNSLPATKPEGRLQSDGQPQPLGLKVHDLDLTYGQTPCLESINVTIAAGTITAVVGANSSGKTALTQVLAGWRPADRANTSLIDSDNQADPSPVHPQIHYAWHLGAFLPETPIGKQLQNVQIWQPGFDQDAFLAHLDVCQIQPAARPKDLSLGKRAALSLATALASPCPITFLDEAFTGLDAGSTEYFIEHLVQTNAEDERTIVLCDHDLAQVERLAQDVIVLDAGSIAYAGPVDDLRSSFAQVTGRTEDVAAACSARQVVFRKTLGTSSESILDLKNEDSSARGENTLTLAALQQQHPQVTIQRVSLHEAVNALTSAAPHHEPQEHIA